MLAFVRSLICRAIGALPLRRSNHEPVPRARRERQATPALPPAQARSTRGGIHFPALSPAECFLYPASSLPDAVLVLHQREPNESISRAPEPDARRNGDLAFAQQEFGELERASLGVFGRDLGPHEHRRFGRGDVPAGAREAFDQRVATRSIDIAKY